MSLYRTDTSPNITFLRGMKNNTPASLHATPRRPRFGIAVKLWAKDAQLRLGWHPLARMMILQGAWLARARGPCSLDFGLQTEGWVHGGSLRPDLGVSARGDAPPWRRQRPPSSERVPKLETGSTGIRVSTSWVCSVHLVCITGSSHFAKD